MKIKISALILLAFFAFVGASPWEGAAATAPDGELPLSGRYVATNSFPRNTVVDIVNIETNKTTRAIVSGGLESPGLLALVSREAAELIGMRRGSVSRIRITQPSDPMAYLRYVDGVSTGINDYDSGNAIREAESNRVQVEEITEPSFTRGERTPPLQGTQPYFLEPEWLGDGRRSIIDLPVEEPVWQREPVEKIEELAEIEEEIAEELAEEIAEEIEEIIAEEIEEIAEEIFEETIEETIEEIVDQTPQPEWDRPSASEYALVPDEDRPPVNDVYGIDPSSIIPGIVIFEPEPEAKPAVETEREIPYYAPESDFSVPRIYELVRGRYYVQVAAYDTFESVENTINDIDRSYKPVVYKDGDNWYRILLGDKQGLNQGESAAVLQRFKSIGYKDAFVRHIR